MSFYDWLDEQEKKKKQTVQNTTKTTTNQKKENESFYEWCERNGYGLPGESNQHSSFEDIAPVGERTWFKQGGLYEDGYDRWDFSKTALGTVGDLGVDMLKGGGRLVEGITDLVRYGAAGIADIFGADETAELIREETEESWVDDLARPADEYLDQYSVLGEKSDAVGEGLGQVATILLLGQLGQLGKLGQVGTTALTTGTTFASGVGSGISEARQLGAEGWGALKHGLNVGATDAISEMIFSGLGKSVKALGFSKGLSSADDMFAKALSSKFKGQMAKNIVEWGVKSGAEGLEEVIAGVAQAYSKSDLTDEDFLETLKDENLFEQFMVGAITSGIVQGPSVIQASSAKGKNRQDFITGHTQNEQAVVNKVYENELAEKEKNGKLSAKEKNALYDEVVKKMERGYIDTDTIESVLGGESYKGYQSLVEEEKSLKEELKALKKTPETQFTIEQRERLNEIEKRLGEIDTKTAKSNLFSEVDKLTANDRFLRESYNEKIRATQDFKADFDKIKGKKHEDAAKKTLENAIKAGANNTNAVHDIVDLAANLSAETGHIFDFKSNEDIKNDFIARQTKEIAKFEALENRTAEQNAHLAELKDQLEKVKSGKLVVDGDITGNGIVLNIDSDKPLNRITGHEVTHSLEQAKSYEALRDTIFAYAKSKGVDTDAQIKLLEQKYKGVKDANPEAELVANLVGDYLFTDSDFINNLSTSNRNLAQRIYDQIKHLCKLATAGSKEARELERVKYAFENAFREAEQNRETQYSLSNGIDSDKNLAYNGTRGESYARTDEFRNLQAESQRMSYKDTQLYWSGSRKIDDELRGRLSRSVKQVLLDSGYDGRSDDSRLLSVSAKGNQFNIHKSVDAELFHDVFEISRKHLQFGELVDLHEVETTEDHGIGYKYCDNYLSEDGLSGFSITPDGDLISVFNASGKKGFLRAIAPYVKENAKTLDCYISSKQNLQGMYESIFGFKTASVMDHNELFDHDDIAKNHNNPKVAFMVNTDSDVELQEFTKDQYDEAFEYRNSFVNQAATNEAASFVPETDDIAPVKYSFSGEKANLSAEHKSNLQTAKNMKEDGNSNEEIYSATGWYTQSDGKWRTEILDEIMIPENFSRTGLQSVKDAEADRYLAKAEERLQNGSISKETYEHLVEFAEEVRNDDYNFAVLPAFLDAPKLYEAYPQLKEVKLRFEKLSGMEGYADTGYKTIVLDPDGLHDAGQTVREGLAHEIQHLIQNIEGFSTGSTPEKAGSYEAYRKAGGEIEARDVESRLRMTPEERRANMPVQFSLSDSNGNELSPAVQNRFAKSKVVDDDGNLKVVYHGTPNGEFTIFDKSKGSVEGDFGSGFYFTDSPDYVSRNYEGGGPDFENKIDRRAEQIEAEEDISYAEARKRAIKELYVGSHKFEVYLNIENPAIVGETRLLDYESFAEEYDRNDYDSDEDYESDVEYLIADKIDEVIWEVQKNVDCDTNGLAEVLWEAINEGGIDIAQLKAKINDLYLEDSEGNLVGNEVTRQIIESLGYDGIIDNTVSSKFNMGLSEDTTRYIVFKPNQIKNVTNQNPTDNPDINLSLSNRGEDIAPIGNYDFYGKDFRKKSAEDIAPVAEETAPVVTDTNVGSNDTEEEAPIIDAPVSEAVKQQEAESVVGDRDSFVSKQAMGLYEEIRGLKKGVRASQRLGYLLDHGYEWSSIKTALLNIRDNPNQVVNPNSKAESVAREMLGREYDAMVEEYANADGVAKDIFSKMKHLRTELENNQKLREQSNVDFDSEIARLQAEYEAKKNKNTKVANDILRRIERIQRLKASVDTDYGKRIDKTAERLEKMSKPEYKTAMQRKKKQGEYTSLMENLVGNTATWVDKKLGISYKINTLRRNLRDIVRDANGNPDIAKADAIYDELQGKYNHNEAELKRESMRIKKVFKDLKMNHAEDTYAHMLGEFLHNPDSKLAEEDVKEFYEKNKGKIDSAKVDKAIEESRKVFDDLIVRVNERLREQGMKEIPYRKGYFPHFTNPKQGFLAKLFNWKPVDSEIPTSIAGLTEDFNPERSWQSFNKQRKGDTTDYSLEQGLDAYIHGALDWIYHIEDIQKRRALENHIRYVHSEEGVKKKVDEIRNNETYDADEAQKQIDLVYAEANNPLNNFVTDLRAGTNTLANKKSSMDRKAEEVTNRKIYSVMTNLNNRINANMVVGSFSSALTNFIPITQSWMEVSPVYSLKGMRDTIKSTIRSDDVVNKSDFLTNRLMNEEKLYQTGWDKVTDKAAIMMEAIDSFTSQTVWRSKYLQNISEGMSEVEAIKNADQFAENVIAGRSRGNQPTIFDAKNPLTKIFTAFQLEVNNQYGYMFKDAPQDSENKTRLVKGYATAFLGAYAYNALYSSLVGRDAAFDPLSILEDLFGDLFGDDEEEENALLNLTDNVLEEVPFVGGLMGGGRVPLSSALPYNGDFGEIATAISDNGFKDKEWLKPIYYLALPVGGGQIKKTNEGLGMFSDDHPISGSYTKSGKLRYPVEKTFGNVLQAGLFGQYASKNARDYFDNGRSPLSEKQIQEFIDVDIPISDYWAYRDGLKGKDTLGEKVAYIDTLDLPISKKNILANNQANRDEPIDMAEFGEYGNLEEFDYAVKYPDKYKFLEANGISVKEYNNFDEDTKEAYTWAYQNPGKYAMSKVVSGDLVQYRGYTKGINKIEADKDANGKSISGSRKTKVAQYIESLPLDYGQKIILFKSQYEADDSYNREILEYLDSREDISYEQMVEILTELGFTVQGNNVYWD
jgi:hypothetical protein